MNINKSISRLLWSLRFVYTLNSWPREKYSIWRQSPARVLFDTRTCSNWQNTQPVIRPEPHPHSSPTCGRQNSFIKTFIQIVNSRKVGGFAGGAQAVLVHPSCRFHGSSQHALPEIKKTNQIVLSYYELHTKVLFSLTRWLNICFLSVSIVGEVSLSLFWRHS